LAKDLCNQVLSCVGPDDLPRANALKSPEINYPDVEHRGMTLSSLCSRHTFRSKAARYLNPYAASPRKYM